MASPSAVPSLAGAIQLCFVLGDLASPDLNRRDAQFIAEIGGLVQPILLRLQKQLVAGHCPVESAACLLHPADAVRSALEQLQAAGNRCHARHWLLRVLMAREVRLQLQTAFNSTAAALGLFGEAAAAVIQDAALQSQLAASLAQVEQRLASHAVTRHSTLEGLARGLFKHMEGLTDAAELPDMLRFAIREAAATSIKPSSSSSTGDGSSSSSNGSRSCEVLPPGESSLRDPGLLAALDEVAGAPLESQQQQLALHQIISVLEELHEERRRRHQKQRKAHKHHRQQQQEQQPPGAAASAAAGLRRVSEANDEDLDAEYAAAVAAGGGDSSNDDDTLAGSSRRDQAAATAATGAAATAAAHAQHQQHQQERPAPHASGSDRDEQQRQQQQPPRYSEAVEAIAGQLESMLWQNPWDAAALTQLLELLLQVEAAGQQQQQQQQQADSRRRGSSSGNNQQQQEAAAEAAAGQQQAGSRKWWQVGAAARAALSKAQTSVMPGSQAAAAADPGAGEQQQQQLVEDRLHQLASAALDVLLHLTPRPSCAESFCRPVSRDGVCTEAGHSLALPLMQHEDCVPGLAAALFGRPDVAARAAQLLAILLQSGPAVVAADAGSSFGSRSGSGRAAQAYAAFCRAVCSTAGGGNSRGGAEGRVGIAAEPATVLGSYIAQLQGGSGGRSSTGAARPSPGGGSNSAWYGLTHLLHSPHQAAAGAAAEALSAVGSSAAMADTCTSLAATQQARALLLLLSKHKLHPGAAGAAAAALHSLADPGLRPAMFQILANSYCDAVAGASGTLGELLLALLASGDELAARRAASLAAALAPAVAWGGRAGLWRRTFAAAQQLLLAGTLAGGNGSSSRNRTAAARLMRQLLGDRGESVTSGAANDGAAAALLLAQQEEAGGGGGGLVSPLAAAGLEPGEWSELLFEALQLSVQQFGLSGNWEGLHHHTSSSQSHKGRGGGGRDSSLGGEAAPVYDEGWAAAELLGALLQWLPAEACCVPELCGVVLPVLEHLAATRQGSRQLQQAVRRVHQQLLALG